MYVQESELDFYSAFDANQRWTKVSADRNDLVYA